MMRNGVGLLRVLHLQWQSIFGVLGSNADTIRIRNVLRHSLGRNPAVIFPPRQCEERSDMAIQAAARSSGMARQTWKAVWIVTGLRPPQWRRLGGIPVGVCPVFAILFLWKVLECLDGRNKQDHAEQGKQQARGDLTP
jgi:hypothetical protein